MNCMAPRFTFDLASERFDTVVMKAFEAKTVSRHTRDQLIAEVRDGRWNHLLLKRLPVFDGLPAAVSQRAAINVIDFHYEPLVLKGMALGQLEDYFKGFDRTLRVERVAGIKTGGPLWVDSVHHACIFSIIYDFVAHLIGERGYRQAILLQQGLRPEPRLALIDRLLRHKFGIGATYLSLKENWFASLAKIVTPDTVVFYFTDMPQDMFRRSAPKSRHCSVVRLLGAMPVEVETVSGSATFARRLGVTSHVVLDYPGPGSIHIRPFEPDRPIACCPLEDWVFWPALTVL